MVHKKDSQKRTAVKLAIVIVVLVTAIAGAVLLLHPKQPEQNVFATLPPTGISIPSVTEIPTPTELPTPTVSPTPTLSPTPTASPTPTLSPTPTASPTPTLSPTPTASPTPTRMPLATPLDPEKPMIALTFDDGPFPKATNRILDVAEQYGVHFTFFVMGDRVDLYSETIEREYALGCQVANHSYAHKDLTTLTEEEWEQHINKPAQLLAQYVSVDNIMIRPPYGAYNDRLLSWLTMPVIMWSVDPADWSTRDTATTIERVVSRAKDGDFVLMHDLYVPTAAAVEEIVPQLLAKGFQLVTVAEMFEARGIEPEAGKPYTSLPPQ